MTPAGIRYDETPWGQYLLIGLLIILPIALGLLQGMRFGIGLGLLASGVETIAVSFYLVVRYQPKDPYTERGLFDEIEEWFCDNPGIHSSVAAEGLLLMIVGGVWCLIF